MYERHMHLETKYSKQLSNLTDQWKLILKGTIQLIYHFIVLDNSLLFNSTLETKSLSEIVNLL
jgi:hypothetical protein